MLTFHQNLHMLGLDMTFRYNIHMILHGFAWRNPKRHPKQIKNSHLYVNVGPRPNKFNIIGLVSDIDSFLLVNKKKVPQGAKVPTITQKSFKGSKTPEKKHDETMATRPHTRGWEEAGALEVVGARLK